MYVSIHHENKACATYTQQGHDHFLNMQALFYVHAFVCIHASVYVVRRQGAKIYGLHSGLRICIINLNYIALFVYQPAQMEVS